jgi:nucleoside-diphosphate-sugar epimerase
MDVSNLKDLGWQASIDLKDGIKKVYHEVKDKVWE